MNVVVIGFKSAGKSTLGPLLAERMGFRFDDLDWRIKGAASREIGEDVDVRQAFRTLGVDRFREMEASLLAEALSEENLVFSLGGGALLSPAAGGLVDGCCVVYIRVPEENLVRRIRSGGWPAYLDAEADPEAELRRLLSERLPRYEELADVVIDNPDGEKLSRGAGMAFKEVMEWMKSRK
jgi:shikimate kinase